MEAPTVVGEMGREKPCHFVAHGRKYDWPLQKSGGLARKALP
ncbi:hypothetical protein [Aneurinibacillus soli]|nr:hypothetical protein [Aneurinibacillus soli]